jgi:phi13 family phage major tail protein
MAQYVDEFRGTDNLVYAEVTADNNLTTGTEGTYGYVTGDVKVLAPVAEISKAVETASDTKYYDNKPALTINAEGADTITLTIPALDLPTLADIVGKEYDTTLGAFLDGEAVPKYFALGYRLRLTDGTYRYVWRYKGSFAIPDETSQTENAGTDTNNQQLTYTGIKTMHKFTKTGTAQKALVVDERDGKADLSTFFASVTTCDTLQAAG